MISTRLSAAILAIATLAACGTTGPTTDGQLQPSASVRYVNAVPDTLAFDVRFVDALQNFPAFGMARGTSIAYQPITAGSRQIRVFLSSTNAALAQTVMWDTTYNFAAGKLYTIVTTGFAVVGKTPVRQLFIVEDLPGAPAASQFGLRVVNLAAGAGTIDVFATNKSAGVPALPTAAALAYGGATGQFSLPTTAVGDTLIVRAAPTGTVTFNATGNALVGAPGTVTVNPVAGTRVAGSVLTAFVYPTNAAGTTFGVATQWERRPANTAP